MNTKFFLNTKELEDFMSSRHETFVPTPIDEKNISTDWIDDLFDNGEFVMRHNEWLGWIEGCPVRVTTADNVATFYAFGKAFTKHIEPYYVATAIDGLLQDGEDDGLWAVILYDDSTATTTVTFYFAE